MVQNARFSSCERVVGRCKHSALTGFARKSRPVDQWEVEQVVSKCDVSPYVGALPPELRAQIPANMVADVTRKFRDKLEDFLVANFFDIEAQEKDKIYNLPEIGKLFGCRCVLETRGVTAYGISPWEGAFGVVCKMSFPEIGAAYALKVYKSFGSENHVWHGPWFEVVTAFAANKAEPKYNNPVYMASLIYNKYMLSKWAGDQDDVAVRKNTNEIFCTDDVEQDPRNMRLGRRIDWGDTHLTEYGKLSYAGRKLYRQIKSRDVCAVRKSLAGAKNNLQQRDVQQVIELADECGDNAVRLFLRRMEKCR